MSDFDLDSERQARFTNVIDIRNGKIHKEFNKKKFNKEIVTYVRSFDKFYQAEVYHQDLYVKKFQKN